MIRRTILSLAVASSVFAWAAPVWADRVDDLVRIHVEAIGGRERIAALAALKATGEVVAGGKRMRFTLLAQRPDRVRVETEQGGRTLVQGFDGKNPPWEFDTGSWPPKYRDMATTVAKTFATDAEFDDPLVAGPARGFTIEYAGEMEVDGSKAVRLLVTRHMAETFSVLLDPDTYFIIRKIEERKSALGIVVRVVTQYADYRPVEGVLVPHLIGLVVDGKTVQQTKVASVEANPEMPDDTFVRPRAVGFPAR